jgi:hypothetical protein
MVPDTRDPGSKARHFEVEEKALDEARKHAEEASKNLPKGLKFTVKRGWKGIEYSVKIPDESNRR